MIRARTRQSILLVALLALLTALLARLSSTDRTEQPLERPDTRLNYALFDFNGRLLDRDGSVKLEVSSPVLRNDAASGIGTVEAPELRIQQEGKQWYISAESAVITSDREHVSLVGHVYLSRRSAASGDLLEIDTADVELEVTPRTARTDAEVSIRQRHDRIDAVGMRLDMTKEHYELLQDVRAHYEVK
jgi:LPS export ABC transporter protein LptC